MNQHENTPLLMYHTYTICPRSSDPFYIVAYYIKWVTTSWTYGICVIHPKRRIFTVCQTVRFFTLKNVFDQKHKNRVYPCLNIPDIPFPMDLLRFSWLVAGLSRCCWARSWPPDVYLESNSNVLLKNLYTYCNFFCRSLK